jgi:hypothetical protein
MTVVGTSNELNPSSATSGAVTISITNPFIFPGLATFASPTTSLGSFAVPNSTAPTTCPANHFYLSSNNLKHCDGTNTYSILDDGGTPLTVGNLAWPASNAGRLASSPITVDSSGNTVTPGNLTAAQGSFTSVQTTASDFSFYAAAMTNDGTTGTTVNGLVKLTASGNVINTLTTDTTGIVGIC